MTLTPNTNVRFDPIAHTYDIGGAYLIGVTSLMSKHGLSAKYGNVKQETLDHAARMGSLAHQTIEDYINGLPCEGGTLVTSFRELNLDIIETEFLISDNETVASSIDLIARTDKDGEVDIIDMKRTYAVHKNALRWQLGIYRYLLELQCPGIKVRDCYCLPIKKGNENDILADICKPLVKINPVSKAEVKALIQAEKDGDIYEPIDIIEDPIDIPVLSESEQLTFATKFRAAIEAESVLKSIKESIEDYKNTLYNWMIAEGIDEVEIDGLSVKVKKPYKQNAFDSTKFGKEHPELYQKYLKGREIKGNLLINEKS